MTQSQVNGKLIVAFDSLSCESKRLEINLDYMHNQKYCKDLPIEGTQDLRDLILATEETGCWLLHREGCLGVVITMNRETLPTTAMRAAVFKFRRELLYSYKVLVCVLFLDERLSYGEINAVVSVPQYIALGPLSHRTCHIGTRSSSGLTDQEIEAEALL